MVLQRKTLNSYSEVTDRVHHFRHVHLTEVVAHLVNLRCQDVGEVASVGVVAVGDIQLCRSGSCRASASGVRDERFVPALRVR